MKPREARQHPNRPLSVRAAPEPAVAFQGVTIQREALAPIAKEIMPLFRRHHDELAVDPKRAPLDVDWDLYLDLNLLGQLQILTVRANGALVGYIFNVIRPNPHKKSTRWCLVDMYWLDPIYRAGLIGYKLLRENEAFLKRIGIKKIAIGHKLHFRDGRVGKLFDRLGYTAEDVYYGKWIGD